MPTPHASSAPSPANASTGSSYADAATSQQCSTPTLSTTTPTDPTVAWHSPAPTHERKLHRLRPRSTASGDATESGASSTNTSSPHDARSFCTPQPPRSLTPQHVVGLTREWPKPLCQAPP